MIKFFMQIVESVHEEVELKLKFNVQTTSTLEFYETADC